MAKGKKRPAELPEYGTVMMKGVQYYRTRITDADGKRVAIYGLTREELYDRVEDAQKKIAEVVFHRENPTVEEYCEKWLLMRSGTVRTNTLEGYARMVNRYIVGPIGQMYMDEVTTDDLRLLMVPLSKGSSGMYGQLNMLIKNIFNSAEESKVIKENPSKTICARGGKPAKRREALTDEQTAILLDSIRELPPYVFVMIGLYAGLRREEILGLKWDCVFLDEKTPYISVRRAWHDLFSTEEGRQDAKLEKIQEIPLSELHPFKNHPFKVKDDEAMMETADSIKQYGVLVPAIARPDPEGGYELVAGHRRHRASELAEKETMPVIVRDLDDDAATIIMVDSNLQRESLLPSERAFAYKMKLDAIKHQGARTDLTSAQVGPKLTAAEKIAENSPDSKSQIKRFIRLTELIPELLDMVDEKKIALNPAYELSFLKKEEQVDLLDAMDSEQATPSLSQAQRLKKYSQEGHLTLDMMRVIMGEEKKSDLDRVTFTSDTLRKYFPKSYTPQRMQETIIKLLEAWQKKRQRDQER